MSPAAEEPAPRDAVSAGRANAAPFEGILLGIGRSGFVFKTRDETGRTVARKVFDSDALTRLVQYVLLGSANPYAWNRDAVQCALLRREILAPLVRFWFGDKLRVARAYGHAWNEGFRAFELSTEFVHGRPPTLHHPMNRRGAAEVDDLVRGVVRPLQAHLIEAGFDGLLWQAGLGNPVALSNFLLEDEGGGGGEARWVWIDLESGVPALFPANPLALVRFYVPRAWRQRRPLFDDVDVARLDAYVRARRGDLDAALGAGTTQGLLVDTEALSRHQHAWKSMPRIERSLSAALGKGRIDEAAARRYRSRPALWYACEVRRGVLGLGRRTVRWCRRKLQRFAALPWRGLPLGSVRFLVSQTFRARLAQAFVARRIRSWERRGQLVEAEAAALRAQLGRAESSSYLSDFGVHLALKPFVKGVEWFVFPGLFAAGMIGEGTLGLAILFGGCVVRTLYTAGRLVQAMLARHELPWIALVVGALPVLGNFAYPVQIVYSSREEDDVLAQFILYDGFSLIGAKLPIWGGRNTSTEHAFNHLPDRLVR